MITSAPREERVARALFGLAVGLLGAGAGCRAIQSRPQTAPGTWSSSSSSAPARVTSNVQRADYAGSDKCATCHADIYAAWRGSPMHLMTRIPESARVRAPFAGTSFHFKNDTAHLSETGGARFVRLASPGTADRVYRVTRVIGGRVREDFAGVEVASENESSSEPSDGFRTSRDGLAWAKPKLPQESTSEPSDGFRTSRDGLAWAKPKLPPRESAPALEVPGHAPGAELLLPLSYVFETASFRLKGYSVLVGERPGLRAGGVWNETCIFCHNTVPYFDTTWGELYGRGAPSYQGEVVDRLLPRDRAWPLVRGRAGDGALVAAIRDEVTAVGGAASALSDDPRVALGRGMGELRRHFSAEHFVEVGIGCEACHGGSREHVANPSVLPDFAPRSELFETRPSPSREITRAETVNRACARCHQVLFSRYPFTWEGGQRRRDPGGSSITSGEARDFLLGGCARQMSCATCHDPHGADRPEALERLGTVAGNTTCLRCHGSYAAPEALRAHAHHEPGGAGASCVGCHMPRKNMGLGYTLTRYHRIGSPDEPVRVERDRPLECALCHPDKSVAELVGSMERWWGKRYDRSALTDLYGGLDVRPIEATLSRGKAHEQAVALAVAGQAGLRAAAPAVARQLLNPFPLVRYYARRALEALRGPCPVDLDRDSAEIASAVRRCVPEAFTDTPKPSTRPPPGRDEIDED